MKKTASKKRKPSKPAHASRRPRRNSSASGTIIDRSPFACSAVNQGERTYVAQDMRHDEALAYADHISAVAYPGVFVSDVRILAASANAKAAVALVKEMDKAATKLETIPR